DWRHQQRVPVPVERLLSQRMKLVVAPGILLVPFPGMQRFRAYGVGHRRHFEVRHWPSRSLGADLRRQSLSGPGGSLRTTDGKYTKDERQNHSKDAHVRLSKTTHHHSGSTEPK